MFYDMLYVSKCIMHGYEFMTMHYECLTYALWKMLLSQFVMNNQSELNIGMSIIMRCISNAGHRTNDQIEWSIMSELSPHTIF